LSACRGALDLPSVYFARRPRPDVAELECRDAGNRSLYLWGFILGSRFGGWVGDHHIELTKIKSVFTFGGCISNA
jgi:hypothetical protein